MEIYLPDITTSPDTAAHLDGLYATARQAYLDWQTAALSDTEDKAYHEAYEAGQTAYEEAHDALQLALGEAWDLPHPELDAPV